MWTVETLVQAVVLTAVPFVLIGPMDLFDVPWWAWPLWVLVLLAYVAVVPSWRYLVHRWEVTDTAVYTQTGWWTRERRIAPMSRIQTVDHVEGAFFFSSRRRHTRSVSAFLLNRSSDLRLVFSIIDATRAVDSFC